jgi:hypothetical protein
MLEKGMFLKMGFVLNKDKEDYDRKQAPAKTSKAASNI